MVVPPTPRRMLLLSERQVDPVYYNNGHVFVACMTAALTKNICTAFNQMKSDGSCATPVSRRPAGRGRRQTGFSLLRLDIRERARTRLVAKMSSDMIST